MSRRRRRRAASQQVSAETIEPNDFQAELIWAVLEGHMPLCVRAGIGVGKTFAIALLMLVLSEVVPGARVLVVMWRERSIIRNLQPACRALFRGRARWVARENAWVFETGFRVELAYYDRADGADEACNPIEGADMWLVVVDEAQQLAESVFAHANDRARQLVYDINGRARDPGVIVMGRPSARGWHRRLVRQAAEKLGRDPDRHVLSATTHINLANLAANYLERIAAVRTPAQYRAIVECAEMPPEEGATFSAMSADSWPAGNVYDRWRFDPTRPTWLAVDPGRNTPHVLVLQEIAEELDGEPIVLDCVFAELAPSKILTPALALMLTTGAQLEDPWMLRVWPRHRRDAPDGSIALDGVVSDPAGYDTEKHTGLSDIALMRRSPTESYMPGLGVPVTAPSSKAATTRARAQAIQAMLLAADGRRRLVLAPSMLHHDHEGRALYKALSAYTYNDIARAETRRKRYADRVGAVDSLGYYLIARRQNPTADDDDDELLLVGG